MKPTPIVALVALSFASCAASGAAVAGETEHGISGDSEHERVYVAEASGGA